jgi:hypothetical protein
MAISRMQEPRQLYGLGSFVKKITRPIKKVIKSPIGKAALLAGGAYLAGGALGGGGGLGNFRMLGSKFGSLFGGKALSPNAMGGKAPGLGNFLSRAFGGAKSALGGLGTKGILGIGAGAGLLGGLFSKQPEETEEEYQARIEQLGPYLKQYYSNVGDTFGDQAVSPQEVEDFVTSQSIEYQGAKDGGIIGKKKKEKDKSIKEKILPKKKKDRLEELRKELNMQEGGIIMADVDEMEVGPRGKEEVMEESMMEDVRPSGLEKVASTLVDIATTLYKVATPMGMSYKMARAMYDRLPDISKQAVDDMGKEMQGGDDEEMSETLIMVEGKKDGGIMNLGGKEMDLRSGGFVPLGKKERADDVPARLSKNEFVFTADAVRAAGGGSVKKGAQKMYDTMKSLENRIR